ncbi:tol-pal system YbgF family protein [Aristophania vespae]|uniref:hypothetical protein n=1 Tax=Aristophania vespae TaxID=2697033 RepID=UPI00235157A0|nr:hypothetical protein [Aristophania vespae]UMM64494.1 Cell division coordinator CpoB [Aristophania vespae]
MSRLAILKQIKNSLSLMCLVSTFPFATAYADNGLSREDILRQHQQLERQKAGYSSDSQDVLAPPVASDSAINALSHSSHNGAVNYGANNDATSDNLVAQLLERVNSLENQVRGMRGELDQLNNQVQQNQADMKKQIGDMQFAQQNGSSSHSNSVPVAKPAAKGNANINNGTPKPSLTPIKSGQDALAAQRFSDAEFYAREALKSAKTATLKAEADYLLARALAGQKNYRQSAVSYFDAYNKAPKSGRAPEALLGVAASMISLKNNAAACEALDKLSREFPNANARVKSSQKVFRARAACH